MPTTWQTTFCTERGHCSPSARLPRPLDGILLKPRPFREFFYSIGQSPSWSPNSRLQRWCKWAGRCQFFFSSRRLREHHSRKSLRSFIYVAEMWRRRGYSTNHHSRSPMESPQSAVHHISLWYTSNEWQKQAIKPWRACCISGPII